MYHASDQSSECFARLFVRGLAVWAITVLFCVFFSTLVHANTTREIRVGYAAGLGMIVSADGRHSGYGYEYLQEIAKYTGWKYTFVAGTPEECLNRLEKGEIDLLGPIQRTPDRERRFLFSSRSLGREYGMLFTREENTSLFFDDFVGFEGMTVGVVRGSHYNENFEEYRRKHGFSAKIRLFDDVAQQLRALRKGEVDTIATGSLAELTGVRLVARFSVSQFYLGVAPDKPDLQAELNKALENLRTDSAYMDARLFDRYFRHRPAAQPALTREEAAVVQGLRPLRVAVLHTWPPMGFLDDHKQADGIVPDFLRLLSAKSGLKLELVPVQGFADAARAMDSGIADIMACYNAAEKSLFSKPMDVTEDYLEVPVVLMGRLNLPSTRNMRVALPKGFDAHEFVLENFNDAQILLFPTFEACLAAVREGEADSTIVISYLYDKLAGTPAFDDIAFISVVDRPLKLAMGISRSLPPLVTDVVNKSLQRITPREVNECVFTNTARESGMLGATDVLSRFYKELLGVLGGLAMVIAGTYVIIRRRSDRQLWAMAYVDPLTDCANWNRFEKEAASLRPRGGYAFVTLDIENFKLINDYFGFAAGSYTLRALGEVIQAELQENEIMARRDSDIFTLLLRFTTREALLSRLFALQQRISDMRSVSTTDERHRLHTACGVCVDESGAHGPLTLNTLYDRANHARKSVKPAHTNVCGFYDAQMNAQVLREHAIEQRMESALTGGEFEVYYQPKYDLHTQQIMGAEALVRWIHPERGIMAPMSFIPLFEQNGFILKLDMYMLEEVCKHLRRWLDAGHEPVPVAVNISKVHIHTADFVRNVYATVRRHRIPSSMVELELTETAFFSNTLVLMETLRHLRSLGFTLSLDDFGSGYSSLNMLKSLPVQVLKLDRGFIDTSEDEERARKIIRSVVHMAQDLDMRVVSEGVETAEQAEFLRSIGCDYVQGYYFSLPLQVTEFETLLFKTP